MAVELKDTLNLPVTDFPMRAGLAEREPVRIAHDVCVSQFAFLCTGSHDVKSPDFAYKNRPIYIEEYVWIAARAFIGPGVGIGRQSVVSAGAVVLKTIPPHTWVSAAPTNSRPIHDGIH